MSAKKHKHRRQYDRHNVFTLVGLCIALVLCVIAFTPLQDRIAQGLDIRGGLSVIMQASHADGSEVTDDEMNSALAIVQNRVNKLGASEATVQRQGSNAILIQIPGVEDAEAALQTIGKTGQLEFVDLRDITDPEVAAAIAAGETGMTLEPGTYTAFMTGDSINNVTIGLEGETSAAYAVNLRLNGEGTQEFADVSTALYPTHGQIAIVLDGEVQSAPQVISAITTGEVQITGNYTQEEAESLKTILESGSLPVTLEYSTAEVVGPTLGQQALRAGLLAAACGFILVILYLLFFYRGLGILTAANLAVFAIVYLGILAVLSYFGLFALSLAGIAGIVLTIGMAADSSILVLERFKEEIRMGRSVKAASISGVKHAIMTSIDADLVTLVSAAALFFIALGAVRGFGLTLGLGILCDIATMFAFKAPTIRLLAPKVIANNPGFWGIKEDIADGEHAEAAALERGLKNA